MKTLYLNLVLGGVLLGLTVSAYAVDEKSADKASAISKNATVKTEVKEVKSETKVGSESKAAVKFEASKLQAKDENINLAGIFIQNSQEKVLRVNDESYLLIDDADILKTARGYQPNSVVQSFRVCISGHSSAKGQYGFNEHNYKFWVTGMCSEQEIRDGRVSGKVGA